MNKSLTYLIFSSLAAASVATAQFPAPPLADRELLTDQAGEVFRALEPVISNAAVSTVEVRVWRRRVGYGTVVAPGKVLAKWSEVKRDIRSLACRTSDGRWMPATVDGIYRDADLAVLKVTGLKAKPVKFESVDDLRLGSFLALVRPDGEAVSMGVVSVLPRSLRQSDRAFLGIEMDLAHSGPGVKIRQVQPQTGAAAAGLRDGDVITGLKGRAVNGHFELSTALQRLEPGETIRIKFRRGKEQKAAEVKLGGRDEPGKIPFGRMERMNNMGGHAYNDVRDGFRDVMQSDMQFQPEDCGAPVVDLKGRFVGIAAARAGRIKSFIIPAAAVKALIDQKADHPNVEELAGRALPVREDDIEDDDPFEVLRKQMEETQRLMQEIEEMER